MASHADDTPHGLTPDPPTDDTDVGRLLAGRYELLESIGQIAERFDHQLAFQSASAPHRAHDHAS